MIENAWYLYASPVSLWEIIFKCQIGKMELKQSPRDWFKQLKDEYDIKMLPLTEEAAALAAELPLHHRDPADRFIIATAKLNNLPGADERTSAPPRRCWAGSPPPSRLISNCEELKVPRMKQTAAPL